MYFIIYKYLSNFPYQAFRNYSGQAIRTDAFRLMGLVGLIGPNKVLQAP